MAKRRRTRTRTKTRRIYMKPKRRSGRRKGGTKGFGNLIGSVGYGIVRSPINDYVKSTIPNIGGELGDELAMGVISFALANRMIPLVKNFKITADIGKAGLNVEGARLGEYLADRFMNKPTSTSPTGFGATLG